MPATSSRMSSSSSTMRISDAIIDLFCFSFACRCRRTARRCCKRQDHADHCAAPFMEIRRRIMEFELAAMVLHDLLDDGEAKPRPLLARRHIGLEKPLAIVARQSLAIVDHVDADGAVLAAGLDADGACPPLVFIKSINGLCRILDDVAECLCHQPAVERALQGFAAES